MLSFHHCSLLYHLAVTGIYIMAIILRLLIYAAANLVAAAVPVSHILFEADTAALLEHMTGVVGETLLVLHGACAVRQPCDPAHFLVRVAAARTAHTARTF